MLKKLNPWPLIGGLAAVAMLMVLLGKCSHPSPAPFAKEYVKSVGDTLDVGIQLSPSIYSVRGNEISGHDYEILEEISRQHGIHFKYHPFVPLAHAMEYLEGGLYDIVVASMPATSTLKERFLMTDPVYLDRQVLVQLRDSTGHAPISSQIQLGGDTVWITADSPVAERIYNLSKEIGDTIYINSSPDYSAEHLLMLVARGVIRQAVVNENIAKAMAREYPQVDIATPVSFTQFQSWAVHPRARQLADSLNLWLSQR